METRKKKQERILQLLASAYALHQQWLQVHERAIDHIQSMSNLAEQLTTLHRCLYADGKRLGCLSCYPSLAELLEAKILASFERALNHVHKASKTMKELCKQLKSHWKEAESLLTNIIVVQGDDVPITRTVESFSLCDITDWLRLLHAVSLYDLTEKQATLDSVSCSPTRMEQVCKVWERKSFAEPTLSEVLQYITYTVEHNKKTEQVVL